MPDTADSTITRKISTGTGDKMTQSTSQLESGTFSQALLKKSDDDQV